MTRLKTFLKTTLMGGIIIVLPVAILILIFKSLFDIVTGAVQPLTYMVLKYFRLPEIVADIFVIVTILMTCFFIGIFIKTRIGNFTYGLIEKKIFAVAPGYGMIKEIVMQILGRNKSAFSRVALVKLFNNDTLVTTFITDEHEDGSFTVFMPTGPNPTSGNIFHLNKDSVFPVEVSVEETLRSIISCGAGSAKVVEAYNKKYGKKKKK